MINWHNIMTKHDAEYKLLFKKPPIIIFRKAKTIGQTLVHSVQTLKASNINLKFSGNLNLNINPTLFNEEDIININNLKALQNGH